MKTKDFKTMETLKKRVRKKVKKIPQRIFRQVLTYLHIPSRNLAVFFYIFLGLVIFRVSHADENSIISRSKTWYVSQEGSNENSGMAWDSALPDLQSALNKAHSGDVVILAPGKYAGGRLYFGGDLTIQLSETIVLEKGLHIDGPGEITLTLIGNATLSSSESLSESLSFSAVDAALFKGSGNDLLILDIDSILPERDPLEEVTQIDLSENTITLAATNYQAMGNTGLAKKYIPNGEDKPEFEEGAYSDIYSSLFEEKPDDGIDDITIAAISEMEEQDLYSRTCYTSHLKVNSFISANSQFYNPSIEILPSNPSDSEEVKVFVSWDLPAPCYSVQSNHHIQNNQIIIEITQTHLPVFCMQVISPTSISEEGETIESESFIIRYGFPLHVALDITNASLSRIHFGFFANASNQFDPKFDRLAPPPLLHKGSATFIGKDGSYNFAEDIQHHEKYIQWVLEVTPYEDPISLHWDRIDLPSHSRLRIAEACLGQDGRYWPKHETSLDMNEVHELHVVKPTVFIITWTRLSWVTIDLHEGWNLISLPIFPLEPEPYDVFPDTVHAIWQWRNNTESGEYEEPTTIVPQRGYWIKSIANSSVRIHGFPIRDDSLRLHPGWNLAGPLMDTQLPRNPDNVLAFWGFWNDSYYAPKFLQYLQGYWIYTPSESVIELDPLEGNPIEVRPDMAFTLQLGQEAYLLDENVKIAFVEVLDNPCREFGLIVGCDWPTNTKIALKMEKVGFENAIIHLDSSRLIVRPHHVFFNHAQFYDYEIQFVRSMIDWGPADEDLRAKLIIRNM